MKKIVIIGGGAGGAGTATKLRRLNEDAEITIYEKSSYASYSNCGLPYYLSKRIKTFGQLLINTTEDFRDIYNINAKPLHEVVAINPDKKVVTVKDLTTGNEFEDSYDDLVIASGASSLALKVQGISDAKNVFTLKTPDDINAIETFIKANGEPQDVVVIGGGFRGLEIAENMKIRGAKNVTVVDENSKLFNDVDRDIAAFGHMALLNNGITLELNSSIQEVKDNGKSIVLNNGKTLKNDLIFVTIGIKPDLTMYEKAGLKIGKTNGIVVDQYQKTNKENIYAVGDIAETFDLNGQPVRVPLAAPASRQAVVAANKIYDVDDSYKGSFGTNAISLFGTTIASVGKTETQLRQENIQYQKVIASKPDFLGMLGGALIWLKLIFDKKGNILGAQATGPNGAEKRITYLGILMYDKKTIYDMVEYQVAYNPVVDTSFDVINMAGRIARLVLSKNHQICYVEDVDQMLKDGVIPLDIRTKGDIDFFKTTVPQTLNVPWNELRKKVDELDKSKAYFVYCILGLRAYNATLFLQANGFKDVKNLQGGVEFWNVFKTYGFGDDVI